MKIKMFSPFTLNSASTHRITSLGAEMVKRGHEVIIVLPSWDRYSNFIQEITSEYEGVKLIRPPQLRIKLLGLSRFSYIFSSILKSFQNDSDVVHILKPNPLTISGVLSKYMHKIPLVLDVDDLDHAVMEEIGYPKITVKFVALLERMMPKCSDHIIVSSSFLKAYLPLLTKRPTDNFTWIPNGVKVSQFKIEEDCFYLKEKYRLKENVVVYVGSVDKKYQLQPLIEAMVKVVKENKDISSLIIGDGIYKSYFEKMVEELKLTKNIVFTGRVPYRDIPKYLKISNIGIAYFPDTISIKSASNVKVFEYMAAGVVPIVSDVGDLPKYVDMGRAGEVIEQGNTEKLSNVILSLIEDTERCETMAKHAQEFVEGNFDWSVLARKLEHVYMSLERRR